MIQTFNRNQVKDQANQIFLWLNKTRHTLPVVKHYKNSLARPDHGWIQGTKVGGDTHHPLDPQMDQTWAPTCLKYWGGPGRRAIYDALY